MTELTDRERAAYAAVDDALRTAPLAPAPAGLLAAVMARLSPPPAFRLAWLDYAVSAFLAGMVGVVLLVLRLLGAGAATSPPPAPAADVFAAVWLMLGALVLVAVVIVAVAMALVARVQHPLPR
jgi:hypothetical protein